MTLNDYRPRGAMEQPTDLRMLHAWVPIFLIILFKPS